MKKRLLALLLVLTLCLGLVPAVFAAEGSDGPSGDPYKLEEDVTPVPSPEPSQEPSPSPEPSQEPSPSPEPSPEPSVPDVSSPEDFSIVANQLNAYRGTAREVYVPEGVTAISSNAFRRNTTMEILHVPYTVTRLDQPTMNTLSETNLKTLYLDNPCTMDFAALAKYLPKVTLITPPDFDDFVFQPGGTHIAKYVGSGGDVVIPRGVTAINYEVFQGNTAITSVTIPDTVTRLSQGTFRGCWSLKAIHAPDKLKADAAWELAHKDFKIIQTSLIEEYIGPGGDVVIPADITGVYYVLPFSNRDDITSITFSEDAKNIPTDFFQYCTGLKKVTAPAGANLTFAHFYGCTSMTDAGLPASLQNQPQFILEGTKLVSYAGYKRDVVVPEGVTEIGPRAFDRYKGYGAPISSIVLPSTVTTLGAACFSNCYAAKTVVLPDGFDVSSAPMYCLAGLSEDTLVTLDGVTRTKAEWDPQWIEIQQEKINQEREEQNKEAEKNAIQQAWDTAFELNKNNKSYLDKLSAARQYAVNGVEEKFYKYTWVTDDVQKLSDQLCNGLTTDRDKVLAIHDWVTENIYYDREDLSQYNAQQVLDNRNCVCSGYARLMQAMCWAQGIPAAYMRGMAGGSHAWNLIRVDGQWLWMDATWDTTNDYFGRGNWSKGGSHRTYCLCPSEFIATDHAVQNPAFEVGINVDYLYYFALFYDTEYPNACASSWNDDTAYLFTESGVKKVNALRDQEGLKPVKLRNGIFYYPGAYGYDDPETVAPEQLVIPEPIDPEEEQRKLEEQLQEEYEKQLLEELKERQENLEGTLTDVDNPDLYPHGWALEEVVAALDAGLVPTGLQNRYADNITRLDFCRLMVQLVTRQGGTLPIRTDNPFTDVNSSEVTAAYYLGIVKGVGEDRFNPSGSITRQEAATMLARTAALLGISGGKGESFSDASAFADWARDGISLVSGLTDSTTGLRVMQGTGGGAFSPLMTYSREQAILTALRLFRCK